MIASPENRNTTAAPIEQADEVARVGHVEHADVLTERGQVRQRTGGGLTGVDGCRGHRFPERTEQRRRGQHRGGDGDALGDGLGGVADGVEPGEDHGALALDVAGHLGDALGVVRDRAEGVHGHDDADGREQASAREGDGEEAEQHGAATQRERAEHRRTDEQRGVDGRLEARPRCPTRITVAGPVSADLATSSTGRRPVSVK